MSYKWKLWYEDETSFSNEDGEPWESPILGVCLVVQPEEAHDFLASAPYVIYREDVGRWMEVDFPGFIDQQQTYGRFITCTRVTRQMTCRREFREFKREKVVEVRGK
jgi:hypothetical protein